MIFCVLSKNLYMSDKRAEIRDWLAEELQRKGYGAKGELARYLGIRPEGVTRILSEKPGKEGREVAAEELIKMGEFFGSNPPGMSVDLKPVKPANSGQIPIRGKVAASSWMDVDDMDFGYDDVEMVPAYGSYPPDWQLALLVEGNCLNKRAEHGDILICLDLIKAQEGYKDGDLVVVERRKFDGQMVQRTAKRVKATARGFELWPESTDPAHQDPIALYDHTPGEEADVVARVLWIIRKP